MVYTNNGREKMVFKHEQKYGLIEVMVETISNEWCVFRFSYGVRHEFI